MITIIKTAGVWLARISGGLIIVWLLLTWVEFQTNKRVAAARAEGKAICEAEQAQREVERLNKLKEYEKNAKHKKAVIWASPALDDDAILRLFDNNEL